MLLVPLTGQQKQDADVYLPDLGMVIDSHPDTTNTASMMLQKQAASAAYMESTRELRRMLRQLSGQIEDLETSLDEDVAAVSLENNRLRSLIGRMQTDREKERARVNALPVTASASVPAEQADQKTTTPASINMGTIMAAYVGGRYGEVLQLSAGFDEAGLSSVYTAQLSYWRAEANYRLGHFEEAVMSLDGLRNSNHALADDALILRGMIYMKQGKRAQARSQFEAIISHYPASDYYRLAEMTLREIHEL